MLRRIIAWSMQLRLVILAGAAVLMFFGFTELRNMPVDVVPEFNQHYVEVQTEALGLSAAEVESMITVPLEADMLNGVPWVEEIRSESIPGLSSIVMVFEPGVDVLVARQMVMENLTEVFALPNVSKPPQMLQPTSSMNRFLKVGLTSDTHSLIDLSVLARWTMVSRLMGVPGVANVSIWGQRRRQLQVQVDPKELQRLGVTLSQVVETAGNALWMSPLTFLDASTPGTGGWIETPNQRLGIQHILPISTPAELAKVPVADSDLRLGDVANVVENHQPLIGDAVVGDAPALMLVVEKFPWANTVEVTKATEEALAALELGMPGVEMDSTLYRPATYLEMVRANLSNALLIALVLVVAGLFALLLDWRTALISTVTLLSAALAALSVLYYEGVTINSMVIAGLVMALAALVDDAIVDVQNIRKRLAQRAGDGSTAAGIFDGALEMRSPLLYATVIMLLAVAPAYFLEGLGGGFARPIILSYALALLASFAVALMVIPALSLLLLGNGQGADRESPVLAALRAPFDGILTRLLSAPQRPIPLAVGALGVVVLLGFAVSPPTGDSIPTFRERDILINLDAAPGTSEGAIARIVQRASSDLRSIPGVRNVSAHLGRAVMSDRITDVNSAELWVSVDPDADYEATVAAIREKVSHYAGFDIDVDTYLNELMREESEEDELLTVRVYGEDLDKIRTKAEEVQKALMLVNAVADPEVQYPEFHPEVQIEVDLARSKQHGIKPGDVRRAAATLLSGLEVGSLYEEQKVFDVIVWGTPKTRNSITDIENLLVDSVGGGHVRLGDVAHVRVASAPMSIQRDSVARHIDVTAGVTGDVGTVTADIQQRLRRINFPLEMRAEVMAGHGARVASTQRVRGYAVAAAVAMVLLLQAAFGSWSLAFLFFLALPVAVLGGVVLALLGSGLDQLGVLLGLTAVFGLAVRNGVTTIRHYRALSQHEHTGVSSDLVIRGTRDRLPAILMSAIVTALAVVPFLVMGNVAGHEILHPMAITILGGLVTATLVNLLVTPSLYLAYGDSAETFELEVEEEAA
jgi:Cu/Ag efflux pump CusA